MIEFILIFNSLGKCILNKSYGDISQDYNLNSMIFKAFKLISDSKEISIIYDFMENKRIYFRQYNGIYVSFICDDLENELATLDFINVFVDICTEVLKGFTEQFIVLNIEKVLLLIDEMIIGGIIVEINKIEVLNNYKEIMKD